MLRSTLSLTKAFKLVTQQAVLLNPVSYLQVLTAKLDAQYSSLKYRSSDFQPVIPKIEHHHTLSHEALRALILIEVFGGCF